MKLCFRYESTYVKQFQSLIYYGVWKTNSQVWQNRNPENEKNVNPFRSQLPVTITMLERSLKASFTNKQGYAIFHYCTVGTKRTSRNFARSVSTFIDLTVYIQQRFKWSIASQIVQSGLRSVARANQSFALSNISCCSCQLLTLSNRKGFHVLPTSDRADAKTSGNYAFTRTRVSTTFASLITAEDNL